MADRTMKAGDTDPPLPIEPRLSTGAPVDLTGMVSIAVRIRSEEDTIACDPNHVQVVGPPVAGNAEYQWQPGDTDDPGLYDIEFQVTWSDGRIRTFPSVGYKTLEIEPNLESNP